ncbi:MAG TPA: hypothetical protein VFS00_14735, partial [Polyangiaceae bacterium]|nr:hypothetical protein [Polyangiaceae bacterium]
QEVVRRALPTPADPAAALLDALHPTQRARGALLLLSFFGLFVSFLAIGLSRARQRPALVALALSFLGLFCAVEILYRSVDFFAVEGAWLRRYAATNDPALRAMLRSRVEGVGDVIRALYAPLAISHMLGSALLAGAFVPAAGVDRWLVAGLAFNALRLVGRFASSYLGAHWLDALSGELYFPSILASFGPALAWTMAAPRPRKGQ